MIFYIEKRQKNPEIEIRMAFLNNYQKIFRKKTDLAPGHNLRLPLGIKTKHSYQIK